MAQTNTSLMTPAWAKAQKRKGHQPPSSHEDIIVYGYVQEGIAVGRSFAMFKNYHIDGNKEMIAFGMMNIAGSCTSCYLTTGILFDLPNLSFRL